MGTIAFVDGVRISVRTRERGHSLPHAHATCGNEQMSVALDGTILAGNLKNAKQRNHVIAEVIRRSKEIRAKWGVYKDGQG